MKQRCNNPKDKAFRYYGAKGIQVCSEWNNDFKAFHDWALSAGYKEGLSIDRIDSNKNYEPTNCQWITLSANCCKATELREQRKHAITHL